MNEPERETVKEVIKELVDMTNWINTFKETDNLIELEKRLNELTNKLIDML